MVADPIPNASASNLAALSSLRLPEQPVFQLKRSYGFALYQWTR